MLAQGGTGTFAGPEIRRLDGTGIDSLENMIILEHTAAEMSRSGQGSVSSLTRTDRSDQNQDLNPIGLASGQVSTQSRTDRAELCSKTELNLARCNY